VLTVFCADGAGVTIRTVENRCGLNVCHTHDRFATDHKFCSLALLP
jgi:hypothetical protein